MYRIFLFQFRNRLTKGRPTNIAANKTSVHAPPVPSSGVLKHPGEKSSRHSSSSLGGGGGGQRANLFAPYHRRSTSRGTESGPGSATGSDFSIPRNLKVSSTSPSRPPSSSLHQPPVSSSSSSSSQLHNVLNSEGLGSPHSAAPSPLTHVHQPSVNQPPDPTMPTLSPHPPLKTAGNAGGASDLQDPAGSGADATNTSVRPTSSVVGHSHAANSSVTTTQSVINRVNWTPVEQSHQFRFRRPSELKRPVLKAMFEGDDDEELMTASFYDHTVADLLYVHLYLHS